jgi:hypothetical protein
MQISPNFSLAEFAHSMTAARLGRPFTVPDVFVENVRRLCLTVLEPLRIDQAIPITVLSGYRPPWLNKIVGGAPTSDHMTASAADILVKGAAPRDVAAAVRALGLPVKQCILEFGQWVHVSVPPPGEVPKREFLTARKLDGRTIYTRSIA